MRVSQSSIRELRERIVISEVIGGYLPLKAVRQQHIGVCPFHDDHRPSLSVSDAKGVYHCFSCQAKGDVITFVMEINRLTFQEAVLSLCEQFGVEFETENPDDLGRYQKEKAKSLGLYEIMQISQEFFAAQLWSEPVALEYLRQRGLESQIQRLGFGYAPKPWNSLREHLVVEGVDLDLAEEAGVIQIDYEGRLRDTFINRLIIPIRDRHGRVISFGGRAFGSRMPKYLNTKNTPIYQKNRVVYGIDRAFDAIVKTGEAIIVEGYFDQIALDIVGINHCVACCGTAFTIEQARSLLPHLRERRITLALDGDSAGTKAVSGVIQELEPWLRAGDFHLSVLDLDGEKDPDELVSRLGGEGFWVHLEQHRQYWVNWRLKQICKDRNLSDPIDFQIAKTAAVDLIRRLSDPSLQSFYVQVAAELLGNAATSGSLIRSLEAEVFTSAQIEQSAEVLDASRDSNPLKVIARRLLVFYLHEFKFRPYIDTEILRRGTGEVFVCERQAQIYSIFQSVGLDYAGDPQGLLSYVSEALERETAIELEFHLYQNPVEADRILLNEGMTAVCRLFHLLDYERVKADCDVAVKELSLMSYKDAPEQFKELRSALLAKHQELEHLKAAAHRAH